MVFEDAVIHMVDTLIRTLNGAWQLVVDGGRGS